MSHVHRLRTADRIFLHDLNPVRKRLAAKPEDWRGSSYNNFALDKASVAACRASA